MPNCSGLELAKVIRQQKAFISTPIVYLSGELDLEKQMEALSMGGDDFLIKPVQAEHLILTITSRAKRHRILRKMMSQDSLTGLLNHRRIKEQLHFQIETAKRTKSSLAYATLDIDFFKSVNDDYGHPVGDQVIKSLSHA